MKVLNAFIANFYLHNRLVGDIDDIGNRTYINTDAIKSRSVEETDIVT